MCIRDKYKSTDLSTIKDFASIPELRLVERFQWVGPWMLAIACLLIGGWGGLLIGFFLSTVLLWHGTFLVNSMAHLVGRRRYATPASSRQGFTWWEYDPTWYVLRGLAAIRVVRDLKDPPARLLDQARVRDGAFDIGMFRAYWERAAKVTGERIADLAARPMASSPEILERSANGAPAEEPVDQDAVPAADPGRPAGVGCRYGVLVDGFFCRCPVGGPLEDLRRAGHRAGGQIGDPLTGDLGGAFPVGPEHPDVEGPVAHPGLVEEAGRWILEIAYHPDGGEAPEGVPGRVELPPGEALAGRCGQVVVVVVPTLTSGDHRDHRRVPTGVRGGEPSPTHQVGGRVDQEGAVPEQDGGEEEPDEQATPSSDQEAGDGQHPWADPIEPFEQTELGVGGEVLDGVEIGALVLRGQDPADVAPPEPVPGRVHITVEVGVPVVDAVVAGPPQGAL